MLSQPRMEIMDNAFGCSRATQVLMETPESVNLTEFHPRYNNKQTNLLVFTLEGHTHETTIKLKIADNKNLLEHFDVTTKLARTGSAQGSESGVLNR